MIDPTKWALLLGPLYEGKPLVCPRKQCGGNVKYELSEVEVPGRKSGIIIFKCEKCNAGITLSGMKFPEHISKIAKKVN